MKFTGAFFIMFAENTFKPIRNHKGYFIHKSGFVFKSAINKDIEIETEYCETSKYVYLTINGKKLNLFYLMVEYFMPQINQNQKYRFTRQKFLNNRIAHDSIKIVDVVETVNAKHDKVINTYGCISRSASANIRCNTKSRITHIEVAECLIRNEFKCVYCGDKLNFKTWHLDHYIPISKGGKNTLENLVSSCSMCNMMKSNHSAKAFYSRCIKIVDNFKFKELELNN